MHLLILRFSAMGDVALLVPVLSALAGQYSSIRMTLVTRRAFEPFFFNIPGVEVIGVDLKLPQYRGLRGIYRLYRELKTLGPYDHGIDVHGSTRSRLLRLLFRLQRLPFAT
ncbi:MAG: heptosyltransferase, partial [Leptospiraceae bacterium]|nr:heptosyltransferase [Leptospiraceae bacterium]